jgi:hypothetical protein
MHENSVRVNAPLNSNGSIRQAVRASRWKNGEILLLDRGHIAQKDSFVLIDWGRGNGVVAMHCPPNDDGNGDRRR